MKMVAALLVLCSLTLAAKAGDPYRDYLLSKVYLQVQSNPVHCMSIIPSVGAAAFIPHYETPKGAIFCRMEDKVTRATKVWLKLGVE